MRKFLFFLPLFLLFFSLRIFADQGGVVAVTLSSGQNPQTEPGRILSASFLVNNTGLASQDLSEELSLPEGWQVITPQENSFFLLSGRQQQLRIAAFQIPQSTPPGIYQVVYLVRNRYYGTVLNKEALFVKVSTIQELQLFVEDKPQVAIAGDSYSVKFRLLNLGNTPVKLKLKAQTEPENPVKLQKDEFFLKPGEAESVSCQVKTDQRISQSQDCFLKVKADSEDSKYQVEQIAPVRIISKITGSLDPYFRIPSSIRLSLINEQYTGQTHTWRFQREISGGGPLDPSGQKNLDFLFRYPNLQKIGPYGQFDESRLNYRDKLLDLHLGDTNFSLSPLTDQYKYGRGVGVNLHPAKLEAGGFYLKERWVDQAEIHKAAYLAYRFSKSFMLRGNFLNKTKEETDDKDRIYSLQAIFNPAKELNFNLEYGKDFSRRNGSTQKASAYYADIFGHIGTSANYNLELIHADPGYYGYYNDMDSKYLTADFPVYKEVKGNIFYRLYKNNLDSDPAKITADKEQYYGGGFSWPINKDVSFSLNYETFEKKDTLLPADYNFLENVFIFGSGWSNLLRIFNFQGFLDVGRTRDRLSGSNKGVLRERVYLTVKPNERLSFDFYASLGNSRFSNDTEKSKSAGVSVLWQAKKYFFAKLGFERYNYFFLGPQAQDKITSQLAYSFPNGHQISLDTYWSKLEATGEKEASVKVAYTIPWDIPVWRKKDIGVLKGKVIDEEKQGEPVAGVVLIAADATAVTNSKGAFVFPALSPGKHSLSVNKPSIGLQRTASRKLPLAVEIKGGQTTSVEIGIITASRVFGRLRAFDFKGKPGKEVLLGPGKEEPVEKGGLANVLIELSSGEEVIQQRTDSTGGFSFEDLRPGKWTLLVNEQDLLPDYYPERKEWDLTLEAGQEKEVLIKALPRLKQIQILEKGELKLERTPEQEGILEKLRLFLDRLRRKPR